MSKIEAKNRKEEKKQRDIARKARIELKKYYKEEINKFYAKYNLQTKKNSSKQSK